MKKVNKTKYAILGLLTIKSQSGYDMKKIIEKSIAYFWSESNGQLYPTLNQLIKEGLIILSKNQPAKNKLKKIYTITPKGLLELQRWQVNEEEEKMVHRDEVLLKLFFGKTASRETCIKLLKNRKQRLLGALEKFNKINEVLKKDTKSLDYIYWLISLNNGLCSIKAEINWCKTSINLLKNHQN